MIKIIQHIFRKKRTPIKLIKDHIKIFENMIHFIDSENPRNTKIDRNIYLRVYEQEEYLNRLLNSEFETNIFDFRLKIVSKENDNTVFSSIKIKSNNLKSELTLLNYSYKSIKNLSKNFKSHTYILKDKDVLFSKNKTYKLYGSIGRLEIYILKGHENGI